MSSVLMIRHLPTILSFQEKEQLLKHFGAEKVWETSRKRDYVFASFGSTEKARASLSRLHQLKIAERRLVVEYSLEKEPGQSVTQKETVEQTSAATKHIQEFIRLLNAWNPSVDFYQPPPVHLKYKYPDAEPSAVINIIYSLFTHKPFYVQMLHLMNKMCLDPPFQENEKAKDFFKEKFRQYFVNEFGVIHQPQSEEESELSSDETQLNTKTIPQFKRKRKLAAPIKSAAAVLSTATLPKVKKINKIVNQEEVFETTTPIQEPKRISVVVHQDSLQKPSGEAEVVGEIGKFHIEVEHEKVEKPPEEPEQPTITKKELLRNKISYSDMKVLPVFKNYHPGEPSMRLYIKNLAKTVTEQDVKRIYRRYVEDLKYDDQEQIGFDVRVMQEGRMKGQAFVTFPSVAVAEKALNETNGYLLKEKPMVVQFARAAKKKTID